MNKIIIPTMLAATIFIAGMFVFMPVEKASTVHTSINTGTNNLVESGSIAAATNLDDPAVTALTATRAGMACFIVSVTDTAGGADDPAVNVIIGGITVAALNPADTATATTNVCAQIAAAGTVQLDQQGADVDAGNTVNRAIVSVLEDAA